MQSRPKGITIDYLAKRTRQHEARIHAEDIIQIVDALIVNAHDRGLSQIEPFELPTNFCMDKLDHKTQQILVYSELIRLFEEKGFTDVKIDFTQKRPYLHVRWKNGIADEEMAYRKAIVAEHMIR